MISCYATLNDLKKFAQEQKINLIMLRHAQVCYLYHVEGVERSIVAEVTGYALSTLSKMKNKVLELLDFARQIFGKVAEKTKSRKHKGHEVKINFLPHCGEDIKNTQQVYLFKFYGADRSIPIFSKIGTTAKSAESRLRQEIGEYRNKGFDIEEVDICKIIPCGNLPAESYESYLRAMLVKEYPNTWKKNDRFFGVDINTARFTELCTDFRNI